MTPVWSCSQLLIVGPSTSMNTTSPTASNATRIISSATIRLRTKPRVSGRS